MSEMVTILAALAVFSGLMSISGHLRDIVRELRRKDAPR